MIRRVVSLEEYLGRLVAAGKAMAFARQWATTHTGMARGEFGRIDPLLGKLLGPPFGRSAQCLRLQSIREWSCPFVTRHFRQREILMTGKVTAVESDPVHHAIRLKGMLDDMIAHLRSDIGKVDEPRAQALFETTAEVLIGLRTAFNHYEAGDEAAFRRS